METNVWAIDMNKNIDTSTAIKEAARSVGIDYKLLRAVCFIESSLNPNAFVALDSNAPSYGLCQLQYRTAKELGFKGYAKDLMYAPINAYFAAKNINKWQKKYNGDWRRAVTSYNKGHYVKSGASRYAIKVSFAMKEGR